MSPFQKTPRSPEHAKAIGESREIHQRMKESMSRLETALGKASPKRETEWNRLVVEELTTLVEAMNSQAADLQAEDGLFAEILQNQPRFERRILHLRHQYDDLIRQADSLRAEFSGSSEQDQPDVSDMRQRLSWLLTSLRHFHSRQTDLIYEAIQVDIGEID